MARRQTISSGRERDPLLDDLAQAVAARSEGNGITSRASDRLAYAHDASHYLLIPRAVAVPQTASEVAAVLATARRHDVGTTFRSGGTSLSGQGVTDGLLIDTRRHFRDITVHEQGRRVTVGPGATVRQVNTRLAAYDRILGPDPASESACTIGGVIANNSSGMVCGTWANAYQTIESATLVLASGTMINTADHNADEQLRSREPELWRGIQALRDRIRAEPRHRAEIERQFAIKNTMGYGLNAFCDHDRVVDILLHLVVGSEGTLAFVAEATFATIPRLPSAATGLLVFDDLARACDALPTLVEQGLAAIELLDAASLRVAAADPASPGVIRSLTAGRHAALLVEHQRATSEELAEAVARTDAVLSGLPLSQPATLTDDARERAALWHLRKGLYASVAGSRPAGTTALLEDIAVPVADLAATCTSLEALFTRHGYRDSVIFGHAKDGNVHFMINERFDQPGRLAAYDAFTEDMVSLVLATGGTLKAEHGTGRIMAPYVERQYGPELYQVMVEVKRLCDPGGVLNPGVVLSDNPQIHLEHLKSAPTVEPEVDRCVECGYCEPVCPSKDLTLTPRQRIVLRRELARAEQRGDRELAQTLRREARHDVVETCAVDGMCQTACPVSINTGDLVRRLRADLAPVAARTAWSTAARHWDTSTRGAAAALDVARALPSSWVQGATAAARRLLGAERVPAWSADLPAGGAVRRRRADPDAIAVFLPSCTSTMFGPAAPPGVARALLGLCDRTGVRVTIPDQVSGLCCGTPWKSKGMQDGQQVMAGRVHEALWAATGQGRLPVVVDATSCTEGLGELTALMPADQPLRIIDALTFVVAELLDRLPAVASQTPRLVLHPTCSTRRQLLDDHLQTIAARIAEEVVVPDAWGCCAFAGDRGMLHPELTASATAAEAAEVAALRGDAHASANRTCEIGMSRATGRDYRHVLELLDLATRTA